MISSPASSFVTYNNHLFFFWSERNVFASPSMILNDRRNEMDLLFYILQWD